MNPLYLYPLLSALVPRRRCASTHVGPLRVANLITTLAFVIVMNVLGTPITTATAVAMLLIWATAGYVTTRAEVLTENLPARLGRYLVPGA